MQKIQLLTDLGRHVAYVEIVQFPPDAQPRVVLWGTRVFVRQPSGGMSGADGWFEAFAVASLTPSPGLDKRELTETPMSARDPHAVSKCIGTTQWRATNVQCLACGLYGQSCDRTAMMPDPAKYPPCGFPGHDAGHPLFHGDGCPQVATVDRSAQTTTDGRPVDEVRAEQREQGNRMYDSYIVAIFAPIVVIDPHLRCRYDFRTGRTKPLARSSSVNRIHEIALVVAPPRGLAGGSFPCHKTVDHDNPNPKIERQCAGALIFMYKLGASTQMSRIGERLGMIDRDLCDGEHPDIFGDIDEMLETAVDVRRRRKAK